MDFNISGSGDDFSEKQSKCRQQNRLYWIPVNQALIGTKYHSPAYLLSVQDSAKRLLNTVTIAAFASNQLQNQQKGTRGMDPAYQD